MKAIQWFSTGILPQYIGMCLSEKAYKKFLKEFDLEDDGLWPTGTREEGTAARVCHYHNAKGQTILLVLAPYETCKTVKPIERFGLITHEVVHILQEVRRRWNMNHIETEFEAYFVQAYSQDMMCYFEDYHKEQLAKKRKR